MCLVKSTLHYQCCTMAMKLGRGVSALPHSNIIPFRVFVVLGVVGGMAKKRMLLGSVGSMELSPGTGQPNVT